MPPPPFTRPCYSEILLESNRNLCKSDWISTLTHRPQLAPYGGLSSEKFQSTFSQGSPLEVVLLSLIDWILPKVQCTYSYPQKMAEEASKSHLAFRHNQTVSSAKPASASGGSFPAMLLPAHRPRIVSVSSASPSDILARLLLFPCAPGSPERRTLGTTSNSGNNTLFPRR